MDKLRYNANILFVEQYVFPEGWSGAQISRDIINYLDDNNIKVNLICGSTFYQRPYKSCSFQSLNQGVNLIRLSTLNSNKNIFKNILNQIIFCFKAYLRILLFRKKIDCIIIQTNPPLFLIIAALTSFLKKVPFLVIAMDIYPEHFLASLDSKFLKKFFKKAITLFFDKSYRKAYSIISLGKSSTEILLKKGVIKTRIYEINNWATGSMVNIPKSDNDLYKKWNIPHDSFNIIYSGNLGFAHEFKTIMDAMKNLKISAKKIKCLFVVSGRKVNAAKQYSRSLKLNDYVSFYNLLSPDKVPYSFSLSKIALLTIDENFSGVVYPSKLYGYLARGLPVLNIGPENDISQLLVENSCGFSFRNNDSLSISNLISRIINNDNIIDEYSKNARKYYENNFSSQIGLKKYYSIIKKLL